MHSRIGVEHDHVENKRGRGGREGVETMRTIGVDENAVGAADSGEAAEGHPSQWPQRKTKMG